jgi:hypothetical protein
VRYACFTFACAIAIMRAFARGEERLPGDARRIVDPGLFRFGIAAGRLPLVCTKNSDSDVVVMQSTEESM